VPNILDEILAHKRGEVERGRAMRPLDVLQSMPGYAQPRRDFYGAVAGPRGDRPNLIAEIKRASPSAGPICPEFDAVQIARRYADAGAQALSVLTEEKYFGGRLEFIADVKAAVELPVLRKDFLTERYQLHESRAYGADAVLLIAEAVAVAELPALVALAQRLEMTVLLEVHTREALTGVLDVLRAEPRRDLLLGINNRDLKTQTVDLATTEQLAPLVPAGVPIVAESGIQTRADVARMRAAGACALLIGESLLRSDDRAATIRDLFD